MRNLPGAIALSCALTCASIAAADSVRAVALSGQPAPGAGGATFQSFLGAPVINNAGRVAFASYDNEALGLRGGLWSDGSGALTRLLQGGDSLPGLNGFVADVLVPVLNETGNLSFVPRNFAILGIWTQQSGVMSKLATVGDPAPGTNSTFGSDLIAAYFGVPGFNNSGRSIFTAHYHGGGVLFPSEEGIWTNARGSLELIARIPRTSSAGVLHFTHFSDDPLINDRNEIAYAGLLARGSFSAGSGLYAGTPGAIRTVAENGGPIPGFPSGAKWVSVSDFSFNARGDTAFAAGMTGAGITSANDNSIWMELSHVPQLVAREGDQAPDAPLGLTYGPYFANPHLNRNGQIAFFNHMVGAGVDFTNDTALWVGDPDHLKIIVREGQLAPGASDGATFTALANDHIYSLNAVGQVAFLADIAGPGITVYSNTGLWATDLAGNLHFVAREGTPFEVAPGLIKTVLTLEIWDDTNNEDGQMSSFNDLGELVFHAKFTDGTEGVFVTTIVAVPESSAIAAIVVVAIAAFRCRRRSWHIPPYFAARSQTCA